MKASVQEDLSVGAAGYEVTKQLHSDSQYVLQYAIRDSDGIRVILKRPSAPYPTQQALRRLNAEYAHLGRVRCPNVLRAEGMVKTEEGDVLVLEGFQGVLLSEFLGDKVLDLETFFDVAIQLAEATQATHAARVVHKGIQPSNVLISAETLDVKLMGFHVSSVLAAEAQPTSASEAVDLPLAYISPEQTGRVNRSVDYRSDLYSLGVTFYQMLVGHCPFESKDWMELIHGHIARLPIPPHEIRPDQPPILSDIVLKLLAKSGEDRYQSAPGLVADLVRCRDLLRASGEVPSFEIGQQDVSERFQVSDQLYGRSDEVGRVLQAFERASQGRPRLLLVSGYSGVGKSRLVNEVQRPILQRKGYFVSGKFDQFRRNVPIEALLNAFRELILQVLTESEDRVAEWRERVLGAVGSVGRVIIDVIPETELLIGSQPAVPELPPAAVRNRFSQVFRRFVDVFCRPEHPMCIFLDDLQWVDPATLQWIETMLTDADTDSLLLIGAYRDNEVSRAHPLMLALDRLMKRSAAVDTVQLAPLDRASLNQMVADTLVAQPTRCLPLTEIVLEKTGGNPLFVRQCLQSLYTDGAIRFDPQGPTWTYDLDRVRDARVCDNVVELLAERIRRLPAGAQDTLKLAACIGNRFDLDTLAVVSEQDADTVRAHVLEAQQAGLLVEFHSWARQDLDEYRFLHDRVQQSAQSLLSEGETQRVRLHIGRLMLANSESIPDDEHLFVIAEHLHAGRSLITEPEERARMVEVNLAASRRARNATAYAPALRYVTTAVDFVPETAWATPQQLTLELMLERAACEHQCGNNGAAEGYYRRALDHAVTDLDRARAYESMIHFFTDAARFPEAYAVGRSATRLFGVRLPARFSPPRFVYDIVKPRLRLRGRKVADLIHLPTMSDERLTVAMRLMAAVAKAAYQVRPELCVAVAAKMVNLSIKHGNSPDCAIGYMVFGSIFLGGVLRRHQVGYEFGRLALSLVDHYDNDRQRSEVHFVVGYFGTSWLRPATEAEALWQAAYRSGLNTGDLFHAGCACCGTVQSMFMRGAPMDEVWKESERFLEFLRRVDSREPIGAVSAVRQAIRNLRGETRDPTSFSGEDFDEAAYVEELGTYGSRHFAHFYYVNKMQTLYLWGAYDQALDVATASAGYLKHSNGMLHSAEHHYQYALILAALCADAEPRKRRSWMRRLRRTRRRLQKWASECPQNFLHKARLVAAEVRRIEGDSAGAMALYEEAIESAAEHGYLQVQALANERAAGCHLAAGRQRAARRLLTEADRCYSQWGATAYVDSLRKRYPHLLPASSPGTVMTPDVVSGTLDLESLRKAWQTISGEIVLERLLSKVMQIIIENAGAQKGFLILDTDGKLRIEAAASVQDDTVTVGQSTPLEESRDLPVAVVRYVARTKEQVVLDDASREGMFTEDAYVVAHRPASILCAPVVFQGKLNGILYLENDSTTGAFTPDRLVVLGLLSSQAAISIENAGLYRSLEQKVEARTQELRDTNADLEAANREIQAQTERKSRFLASMSHELRTPITAIKGYVDNMLDGIVGELTKRQERALERVAQNSSHLVGVINDILDLSKIEAGRMDIQAQPFDMKGLIASCCDTVQPMMRDGVQLTQDVSGNVGEAHSDEARLRQVLVNLLSNAAKFTEEGEVKVSALAEDGHVEIRVSDTGAGIPGDELGSIFEEFRQVKGSDPKHVGTGLGLPIAKGYVERLGGSIGVESEAGRGTTFTVRLPLVYREG